jgi:ribosomal protein S18 acetylase RimI-like enzyme
VSRTTTLVRAAEHTDLEAVVRIDEALGGRTRRAYWRRRLELSLLRPPWMSLVAERDGRVVGFLYGWVGESEFGIAEPVAWIDLIGVDPAYRGRGVGQALVDRFVGSSRELRAVRSVVTVVDPGQAEIREFFVRLGFRQGPMVFMERTV